MRVVILLSFSIFNFQLSIAQSRDSLIVRYTDGVRLAAEGRYAEAGERLREALRGDSGHAPSLYELANVMAETGRIDSALVYSGRAVEADPGNYWYRGQRGRLLISAGRFDEALEVFEGTVGAGKFDPDDYRLLAILYYRKGRTEDALATLDSAEVRMGLSAEVVEMRRGILIEAGRVSEAAEMTERFVASSPYDEDNRLALADIYGYLGRDSLRLALLRRVVEINPDNAGALEALADRYLKRGETVLGIASLQQLFTLPSVSRERKLERFESLTSNTNLYRAHYFELGRLALTLVAMYPGDAGVVTMYADHAMRGGDSEGALVMLKGLLERDARAPVESWLETIRIEAYLERADSVALWSDRALDAWPGESRIYMLRAGALQFLKRPKEAMRTLKSALRVATTDSLRSEAWGAIGTQWHETGRDRKCYSAYDRALKYDADNALVLNNYAYFLALEGRDLDRALEMSRRAVGLRENFASYLDTHAWVLYRMGDYEGARRVMRQALPLDREQSGELMMHYGDILWALGERFMATVYWKKARDVGWEPVSEIEERLSR